MSTSTPAPLHHQRTPRTPESYFNVPESIALLNIVKSERIQCAFQSNRKNHASVWEMVANILNRYSNRKRSAKQCCNRYENLKKIYTQLKRNPEKHVRRNWPYMYLFREIEEQRGETWGANGKRAAANLLAAATAAVNGITINNNSDNIGFGINSGNNLDGGGGGGGGGVSGSGGVNISGVDGCGTGGGSDALSIKNQIKNELSYYQRRRNAAALTNMLMNREVMLTNINNNNNNNSCNNGNNNNDLSNHERLMANNFVETEINDCDDDNKYCGIDGNGSVGGEVGVSSDTIVNNGVGNIDLSSFGLDGPPPLKKHRINTEFGLPDFLNNMKDEPISDQESDHDNNRNTFMNNNYNGNQDLYMNGDQNILHPDVIVDTDPVTDSSSLSLAGDHHHHHHRNRHNTNKRKRSISTDDDDDDGGESSTNYELIEYLRRREKRDEQMQRKMDEREERLMKLLERTVVAIERIASQSCTHSNNNLNLNNNNNTNSNNNNNNSNNNSNTEIITKNQ